MIHIMRKALLVAIVAAGLWNRAPGAESPTPAVSGDLFRDDELRSRSWAEYPGTAQGGWCVALRLSTNTFRIGEPLTAIMVYQNVGTNDLRLFVSSPRLPFMFWSHILDVSRREVPMTDDARDELSEAMSSLSLFRVVPPGMKLAFPMELSQFYQIEKPGVYQLHLTANRLVGDAGQTLSLATGAASIRFVQAKGAGITNAPPAPWGTNSPAATNAPPAPTRTEPLRRGASRSAG